MRTINQLTRITAILTAVLALASTGAATAIAIDLHGNGSRVSATSPRATASQQLSENHQLNDARNASTPPTTTPVARASGSGFAWVYLAIAGGVIGLTVLGVGLAGLSSHKREQRTVS